MALNYNYTEYASAYVGNTGYGNVYIRCYARITEQDVANVRSYILVKHVLYFPYSSSYTFWTNSGTTKRIWCSGITDTTVAANGTYRGGQPNYEQVLQEIGGWVNHDGNGNLAVNFGCQFYAVPWGWNAVAQTWQDVPSIEVNSKVHVSGDYGSNWGRDRYVYKTDNYGSSWYKVNMYRSDNRGASWYKAG